jgi:hypothetical protein
MHCPLPAQALVPATYHNNEAAVQWVFRSVPFAMWLHRLHIFLLAENDFRSDISSIAVILNLYMKTMFDLLMPRSRKSSQKGFKQTEV